MTLVEKSQNEIKQMILDNEYDEYGFLPSEGELSEKMSVSRATIREAVRSLEVRGLVKRIHGKGIKVQNNGIGVLLQTMTDMIDTQELQMDEVLEVRWTIETKAAELAATRATKENIDKMKECVGLMETRANIDDEYLEADLRFHLVLVAATQNKLFTAVTFAYTKLLQSLIEASSKTTENLEDQFHYHRNVLKAIIDRDGEKARECIEQHLVATLKNKQDFSERKEVDLSDILGS